MSITQQQAIEALERVYSDATHAAFTDRNLVRQYIEQGAQTHKAEDAPSDELPMQPIVWAKDGVIRFKENRLVRKLLEHSRAHGLGLNELAKEDVTPEEHAQLAQLIGYSVSGWGGLSYVSEESADKADAIAEAMNVAAIAQERKA